MLPESSIMIGFDSTVAEKRESDNLLNTVLTQERNGIRVKRKTLIDTANESEQSIGKKLDEAVTNITSYNVRNVFRMISKAIIK